MDDDNSVSQTGLSEDSQHPGDYGLPVHVQKQLRQTHAPTPPGGGDQREREDLIFVGHAKFPSNSLSTRPQQVESGRLEASGFVKTLLARTDASRAVVRYADERITD